MRCQRCGREVTPLRQLSDRQFCSETCRKKGSRASASALRDSEYLEDPFWLEQHDAQTNRRKQNSSAALVFMLMATVGLMVAAGLWLPDSQVAVGPTPGLAPSTSPAIEDPNNTDRRPSQPTGWTAWLENMLPGDKPVRLRADLGSDLRDWVGSGGKATRGVGFSPGNIRLWNPTMKSKDYEWSFQAAIEKKGMGWAFRAADPQHYYASRILITKPGVLSGASIVRYGLDGQKTFGRAELPLPIPLHRDRRYDITVQVRGDQFRTWIDGRLVDEWRDQQYRAGGVGLFAADDEIAHVTQSDFHEIKGILSRWMAACLFLPPGAMLPW
jgi:hypothetical protein